MNKQEYLDFHRAQCERLMEITRRKNEDYTGDSPDPFANFTVVERLGICSTQTGFLVRMADKFMRIISLSSGRDPSVEDESVDDTLSDLSNYSILMMGYRRSVATRASESQSAAQIQPKSPLRLRVGGKYRTRDGKCVVKIREQLNFDFRFDTYSFASEIGGAWYTYEGGFFVNGEVDPRDLVEEVFE